jgi:hypothetical protein
LRLFEPLEEARQAYAEHGCSGPKPQTTFEAVGRRVTGVEAAPSDFSLRP